MTAISVQQISNMLERIVSEKEKLAQLKREPFIGVTKDDVLSELGKRIDSDVIVREHFILNKDDVNAVANSRFFKKTGQKLVLGWLVIALSLLLLNKLLPTAMYFYLGAIVFVSLGFVVIYGREQRKFKQELSKIVPGGKLELGK